MTHHNTYRVYLIAGEASGDRLGAGLMQALKETHGTHIQFFGVGGALMQEEGIQSLFDYDELSIVGFFEILPHIPKLLARIRQTVEHIAKVKPDIIVTIDAPGFNFRVARKIREDRALSSLKMVHYVAPTVWAYKPERAKKVAKLYDHLLVVLPFEPPYFEAEGLATTFVGNPAVQRAYPERTPKSEPLLAVFPGSRKGEITRHMPVFEQAIALLAKRYPTLHIALAVSPQVKMHVESYLRHWKIPVSLVEGKEATDQLYSHADVALAKSGTVTLELAAAGVPMVIGYKVRALSAWMLRRMILIDFVNLINIFEKREVIPELLQEDFTAEKLEQALSQLLDSAEVRNQQVQDVKPALTAFGKGAAIDAHHRAAKAILSLLA